MRTEAQKRYRAKLKRLSIDFYLKESDMVEHIDNQPQQAATYIKNLIRADMARNEKKEENK